MTTVVATAPSISVSRDHGLASLAHLAASAPPMITSTSRITPPSRAGPASANQSPRSIPRSVDENMSPKSLHPGSSSIKVKKEPSSPQPSGSSKPRPRRLDLSASSGAGRGPQSGRPSGPLTAKDSAHLAMACLSPGIQTQDPAMREQLQRSMDVREQQRQIIEARQKGGKPGTMHEGSEAPQRTGEGTSFGPPPSRAASNPRRKGPPPGLSILAPSAGTFSNERVVQSAPLHQSFTGLRPHAYSQQPSNLSQTSHIHHVPATQTSNRLPPISDVFAHDSLPQHPPAIARPAMFASGHSPSHQPALHSPGFPPPPQHHHQAHQQQTQQPHHHQSQHQQSQPPLSARGREFRSAEEAVREMSRGQDELLPKIVHYGGAQPPTPPSPMPNHQQPYPQPASHSQYHPSQSQSQSQSTGGAHLDAPRHEFSHPSSSRRRTREEYERDNGSPLGQHENKRTSYMPREDSDMDWRATLSGPEKRDEFLRLCARAWDLMHS